MVLQQIQYLGVCLGEDGRSPDRLQVELINKLLAPNDISALHSLMGLTGFSHDFIKNYAELASPLYQLLKGGKEWEWGPKQQSAFHVLWQALTQAPVLSCP